MATEHHGERSPGSPAHVLVVEDAPEFQHLMQDVLRADGHKVSTAGDGERALEMARSLHPDLVVLDLVLPGIDGIEVCRRLRTFTDAYVVMVTSKSEEVDLLIGLAVGADDYISKPFSPRELAARVGVLLRRPRTTATAARIRELGDLTLDPSAREVHVAGEPVALTKIEFDLLDALTESPDRVLPRPALLESVWGPNWVGDVHVVDVHIANLRKKIDRDGRRHIKTVRGVGYRFDIAGASSANAAA